MKCRVDGGQVLRNYDQHSPSNRFALLFVTPERFCRDKELQAILRANAGSNTTYATPTTPGDSSFVLTPFDVDQMTVKQLKDELRKLQLPLGGRKAELAERLKGCLQAPIVEVDDFGSDGNNSGDADTESYSRRQLKRKFRRLVVDEAHCISEWGDGFRPEYDEVCRLMRQPELFGEVPVMLLSGSCTEVISMYVTRWQY